MKRNIPLLLLAVVLQMNNAHADQQQLSNYLPPVSDVIYDVNMTPIPITDLQLESMPLMRTQSSMDRMKTELDKVKVSMRYFLKKDVLKKNGMRPIISKKSITFRYTYRW